MDLVLVLVHSGCDRCAWWAAEADKARRLSGWLTIPKAWLDHLEDDHGVRQLAIRPATLEDWDHRHGGVMNLREVIGR